MLKAVQSPIINYLMVSSADILERLGKRSIFLTGFMGSGKTTIGFLLASRLGIPFYDLDHIIENQESLQIVDLIDLQGEDSFRTIESELLEMLLAEPTPNVISFGGGALVSEVNRTLVRSKGILISLKAKPEQLICRLSENQIGSLLIMAGKPISDALFVDKVLSAIVELYEIRKPVYDDVDFSVFSGSKSIELITEEIIDNLECELF